VKEESIFSDNSKIKQVNPLKGLDLVEALLGSYEA